MSLLTTWGYTLTDVDELPDLLTVEEFNELTANKYATDGRVAANISAASSAVRNYCSWHVYPGLACELDIALFDRRVSMTDREILVQLPARFVPEVTSVEIAGEPHTDFVLETNGILRIYNVRKFVHKYTRLSVEYTAGIPDAFISAVKELIAHRVTHSLASSAGVQSETAGGVSITYNANWVNSSRATALADDNKEVLAPYRIQGVF